MKNLTHGNPKTQLSLLRLREADCLCHRGRRRLLLSLPRLRLRLRVRVLRGGGGGVGGATFAVVPAKGWEAVAGGGGGGAGGGGRGHAFPAKGWEAVAVAVADATAICRRLTWPFPAFPCSLLPMRGNVLHRAKIAAAVRSFRCLYIKSGKQTMLTSRTQSPRRRQSYTANVDESAKGWMGSKSSDCQSTDSRGRLSYVVI